MSGSSSKPQRVVPAQLSFLAIYNPGLGKTDETLREQIVYYGSKEQQDEKGQRRQNESNANQEGEDEENERLRQVGLAQGIMDFAKNFSSGAPVDCIDTEKSRIVLHELEPSWWILASIDLTRLPSTRPAASTDENNQLSTEYSSREVSPAQLLIKQLIQAHSLFLLLHASSMQDLWERLGKEKCCRLLERYWTKFTTDWDVMLHGNPAVDIYNGVKLAGGGELGVGVGEEEWGSGEREVLEDFITRTDGLVDLVVSRFGDVPVDTEQNDAQSKTKELTSDLAPWLGVDINARASDGVVFSGISAMSRRSLATVSQWIEAIFKNGEMAYGVGENPSSRQRQRPTRRRRSPKAPIQDVSEAAQELHLQSKSNLGRALDIRKKAIANDAAQPSIPPPLVATVEMSLDHAISEAETRASSGSPGQKNSETEITEEQSMFGTERMIKYLKLGYGSSWTLSPAGLTDNYIEIPKLSTPGRNSNTNEARTESEEPLNHQDTSKPAKTEHEKPLQQIDPKPEISHDKFNPVAQRFEQSIGKFIIGLFGDLENTEFDLEDADSGDTATLQRVQKSRRILLRTVSIEMSNKQAHENSNRPPSMGSNRSKGKKGCSHGPTSAGDSVDGTNPIVHHQKLQVSVYVHQPFIFVFLFQLQTPSLTMPTFYQNIHHQLGPLQKPLLRSTDPAKAAERIAEAMGDRASTTSPTEANNPGSKIYDIVYDPIKLSVRTSIPNIPIPGSLAAEGLSSGSASVTVSGSWYTLGIPISSGPAPHQNSSSLVKTEWNRIEALNVHTQVLNTWLATRTGSELERTVKTGRGWWVLWMQVPSQTGDNKEAFLVRRATDHKVTARREPSSGKWLLREKSRDLSGSSTRSVGPGSTLTTAGVSEGVGVDPKKWIEGLLHFE